MLYTVNKTDVLLLPEAREDEKGGDEGDEADGIEVLGPVGPQGHSAGCADDGQHRVRERHDAMIMSALNDRMNGMYGVRTVPQNA